MVTALHPKVGDLCPWRFGVQPAALYPNVYPQLRSYTIGCFQSMRYTIATKSATIHQPLPAAGSGAVSRGKETPT
jgi:hypothetical protein